MVTEGTTEYPYQPGCLYVRTSGASWPEYGGSFSMDEKEFLVQSPTSPAFRVDCVARGVYGSGQSHTASFVDTMRTQSGITSGGVLVERSRATDQDIRNLVRNWGDTQSVVEWLIDVVMKSNLNQNEIMRIVRIAYEEGHRITSQLPE